MIGDLATLRIVGTLHNRRGDPLLLLKLLRILARDEKIRSIGVAWSVPSGKVEPSWEELVAEERRVQETVRGCVRMVHESKLSWDARSFLGRCYRSFQYEFMVSLNLKRNDRRIRIFLLDDPGLTDLRYQEIGNPKDFLTELSSLPTEEQAQVLRSRYNEYKAAYEDLRIYEKMALRPNSALLEISSQLAQLVARERYILERIEESSPDVVLLRLVHCLTQLPSELKQSLSIVEPLLAKAVGSMGSLMKLSEAVKIVGPLPIRD